MSDVLSRKLMLAFPDEPTVWCPACEMLHRFNVKKPNDRTGAQWKWDGNAVKPTFSPSLIVNGKHRCHSFLRNGVWEYLKDCTHSMAGQKVPLPDLPEDEL